MEKVEGKRPDRLVRGPVQNPARARAMGEKLKALWADPEWRANLIAKRKEPTDRARAEGRTHRTGIPPGMSRKMVKRFTRQAKFEATLTMKKLDQAGVLDGTDTQAREALHYAITMMRNSAVNYKDKLAAARTVLEWTKAKPAQKQEVTISKAEEWLDAVTSDNAKVNEG